MLFGKIKHCILMGGGQLLSEIAPQLKQKGFKALVVTSVRHSKENVQVNGRGTSFINSLKKNKIEVLISRDISSDARVINTITAQTLGISSGAAWIFKSKFIKLFNGRLVNLHGTRLPQDRGGGGFSWRILRNERMGVSLIHQINAGVDRGDIILHEEFLYPSPCRIPLDYQGYTTDKYRILLSKFFTMIENKEPFTPMNQLEYFSSYWPRLCTDIHGYIDWNWALKDIEKFICAFDEPYGGAITFINKLKVRLKNCCSVVSDGTFHPFQKGIIYRKRHGIVFVATDQGTLLIQSVTNERGKEILNTLNPGDRFFTPVRFLEKAKEFRAVYTPAGLKIT